MSSPAAGKFQDHYKLLAVDAKADLATIQHAHAKLMACQPSLAQIEDLNLALEVLSDPISRKLFDGVRGGDDEQEISFTGMEFFENLKGERARRSTILCVLYDVRRQNPRVPVLTMRQLELIVRMTEDEIQLVLWYLKTLGWVLVDDKSKMQITALGVDYLQNNVPNPDDVWPYLKMQSPEPEAVAEVVIPIPEPIPVAAPPVEPIPEAPKPKPMSLLRRTQIAVS